MDSMASRCSPVDLLNSTCSDSAPRFMPYAPFPLTIVSWAGGCLYALRPGMACRLVVSIDDTFDFLASK